MRARTALASKLDTLKSRCREHGLPLTVQRGAILEALAERDDHPSADQVYDAVRVRLPGISRMTVYRVLRTLVRLGVAARVFHPGDVARYDGRTERHHHLVCLACERTFDLEDPRLDALPVPGKRARVNFEITDYSVYFRGVCGDCRAADSEGNGGSRRGGVR